MKSTALVIALLLSFCGGCWGSTSIAPNSASLTYIGRWADITVSSAPVKLAMSGGTRVRFNFTGTSLSEQFDLTPTYSDYPVIEYAIDGGTWTRATVNTASITLATGLNGGTHTVEIWCAGFQATPNAKWTTYAGIRITGFTLDTAATISPWPTGLPRMLTIGDSTAEGMLNLGSSPNAPVNFSGRLSYSSQVAALISVENWNNAYGGSGFYGTDVAGNIPATDLNYPYIANGIAQNDPAFSMVLISVGNNDGGGAYSAKYQSLFSQVLANNPLAKIFVLGKTYNTVGDFSAAQTAVSSYNSAHGTSISYITTTGLSLSFPYLGHPSVADDTAIANYLAPIMQPYVPTATATAQSAATMRASFR